MLIRRLVLASAALIALAPFAAHAQPNPVSVPDAPGDPLEVPGTGLCIASAATTRTEIPGTFGTLNTSNYNGNMNSFMEVHKADRVESVIRTILDLSNNNEESTRRLSYGDFTGLMAPTCRFGGCDFFINDTTTPFVTRMRGYLNVTEAMAGQPTHIGFYTDDAVSLTFFDKDANPYAVVTRPPIIGSATWRSTNTVTFDRPGLYPLEILYVEISEHAAVEMSYLVGDFTDYELAANEAGSSSLKDAGYTIYPETAFFQTLSGVPSYEDVTKCQQCERRFANLPGNNGCGADYYCNDAALCAPCDTAKFCGPECSPCGGNTPFCINANGKKECGGCRADYDCKEGFHCDQSTHTCEACTTDDDCPRGEICVDNTCAPCDTPGSCAGNSCNCCPLGSNGKQMQCAVVDGTSLPMCVECVSDADCTVGDARKCDRLAGHCVDEVRKNNTSDHCGDDGVKCPADFPFCIPGPVGTACAQCRADMDCPADNFCVSGECKPCVDDRHCGTRCDTCGGDKPFCLEAPAVSQAVCVRCTSDDQCNGGKCNLDKFECEASCLATCAPETPYCDGSACVECYADTQCPCGNTCDPTTHTCDTSCTNNGDCLGNEHCRWKEDATQKECALGPMPDDVACGGTLATACSGSIGQRGQDPPPAGFLALALLALLGRRRTGASS